MKRSFTLVVCLLLVVSCFASCMPSTCESTGHSFYETWTSDAENHWHAASCGHITETADKAAHTGMDDGICDVCKWGDTEFVPHSHTFGTTWTSDENGHWNAASCEHDDQKDNYAAHVTVNGYSGCVICGYGHEHTYADTWTSDADNHWHAPSCGHDGVDNADVAAHVDEDNDGACDVCAWDNEHEHTYAEEWTITENHEHYHAATCGHDVKGDYGHHVDVDDLYNSGYADGACDVCGAFVHHAYAETLSGNATHHYRLSDCGCLLAVKDYAAHADADEDGFCDDCYYAMEDFNDVIENTYAEANLNKANSVTIVKPGYYGDNYIYVTFGSNFTLIEDGEYENTREYIPYDDNGVTKILVVDSVNGRDSYADENAYYGYKFDSIADGAYGVEALVKAVYEVLTAEENAETVCGVYRTVESDWWGVSTYKLSFALDQEWRLAVYSLEFTVDENGVIATANVSLTSHYEYYVNAELDYYMGLDEGYTYEYQISQYVGERTEQTETKVSDYIVSSIEFEVDNGDGTYTAVTEGAQLSSVAGGSLNLDPQNKYADLAAFFTVTAYSDAEMTQVIYGGYYVAWGTAANLNFTNGGTYYFNVVADSATLNFSVVVEWNTPTSIGAEVGVNGGYAEEVTEVEVYVGANVSIVGKLPSGCEPVYTAALTGDNAANATLEFDALTSAYVFTTETAGTYTVLVTATKGDNVTVTVTVVVKEAPTMDDIVADKYIATETTNYGSCYYTVEFTPSADSALSGTAVLVDGETTVNVTYVFDENSSTFVFTPVTEGEVVPFDLALDASYNLVVSDTALHPWFGYEMPVEAILVVQE